MPCHHIVSRVHAVTRLLTVHVNLDHLPEVVYLLGFSIIKLLFSAHPCCVLWKESTICSPHLKGKVELHLLVGVVSI